MPKAKHPKTSATIRTQHIDELEEDIRDLKDQLLYKEKRRNQAELSRNYKVCDQIMEEMTELKRKKREKNIELKFWLRKVQQSNWYQSSRRSKSTSETDDEICVMTPQSPAMINSPTPSPQSSISSPHHAFRASTPMSSTEHSMIASMAEPSFSDVLENARETVYDTDSDTSEAMGIMETRMNSHKSNNFSRCGTAQHFRIPQPLSPTHSVHAYIKRTETTGIPETSLTFPPTQPFSRTESVYKSVTETPGTNTTFPLAQPTDSVHVSTAGKPGTGVTFPSTHPSHSVHPFVIGTETTGTPGTSMTFPSTQPSHSVPASVIGTETTWTETTGTPGTSMTFPSTQPSHSVPASVIGTETTWTETTGTPGTSVMHPFVIGTGKLTTDTPGTSMTFPPTQPFSPTHSVHASIIETMTTGTPVTSVIEPQTSVSELTMREGPHFH